jgi:hypothetical protein
MSLTEHAGYAATLLAVDPFGLGGVCLRSPAQPARERWLRLLRESLPERDAVATDPEQYPARPIARRPRHGGDTQGCSPGG